MPQKKNKKYITMAFSLMRNIFSRNINSTSIFPRFFSISHSPAIKASEITKENLPSNLGCPVCSRGITFTKNDVLFLSQFMTPEGYMMSRRQTGVCRKQQRRIFKSIHIARREGLLPRKPPKDGGEPPEYGQKSKSLLTKTYKTRFLSKK